MPKVKRTPSKKKVVRKPKPKPFKVPSERLVSAGVRMSGSRHALDELLAVFEGVSGPVQEALGEAKAWIELIEDRLADLGIEHYPRQKWPITVAYWRDDVERITY